jgi:hypothetical protein
MDVSVFAYKLAIIFIPGIMGRFLLGRLLFIRDADKFYFTLTAFLFGVVSYVAFDLFAFAVTSKAVLFSVTNDVFDFTDVRPISVSVIIGVTGVSLLLSAIWAFFEKKRLLAFFFQKLGVTNRIPEPDIWSYLLKGPEVNKNRWIIVRDRKYDLSYRGYLSAFSDLSAEPELLLSEVTVYKNSTGRLLYTVNALYLSIEPERIEIECLPNLPSTKGEECDIIQNNNAEGGHPDA